MTTKEKIELLEDTKKYLINFPFDFDGLRERIYYIYSRGHETVSVKYFFDKLIYWFDSTEERIKYLDFLIEKLKENENI